MLTPLLPLSPMVLQCGYCPCAEQTGKKIAWIGEELGGFLIMSALALGVIDQKTVSSCVYLEENRPLSPYLNNSKIYSKTALWRWKKPGVISGRRLKLGSENESYLVIREFLRWKNSLKYSSPAGLSLDDIYKNITVPTMLAASNTPIQSETRNAQWIYNQLSSTPKLLKKYDFTLHPHQNIYDEGGGVLAESNSGCWSDIVYWLEKQYSCLGLTDNLNEAATECLVACNE